MRTRTASTTAFTATLALGAVLLAPTDANSATTPITSGTGWKLQAPAITHVDSRSWTIAFHDAASRTKLTPYLKRTAAELTSYLGVKITVSTRIVPITRGTCLTSHVISYRYMSKPDPASPNRSFTGTCATSTRAAHSAYVYINADYWSPTRRFSEPVRKNVIWHESAHAVGLSHPNTCPTNKAGLRPLMCADTYKDLRDRRYSPYEATAFRQLVKNRAYTAVGER
ncbi:hypothetical protein ACFQ0X_44010 [Streptomyces rectiviolaceus]|uniref:Peptidase M10 metallopeptidase domain-containing protein n=1 Tax=Streptomyces rectiviolaceus TaxID=332591 RepID=A0ABP6NNX6_9ACTN